MLAGEKKPPPLWLGVGPAKPLAWREPTAVAVEMCSREGEKTILLAACVEGSTGCARLQ